MNLHLTERRSFDQKYKFSNKKWHVVRMEEFPKIYICTLNETLSHKFEISSIFYFDRVSVGRMAHVLTVNLHRYSTDCFSFFWQYQICNTTYLYISRQFDETFYIAEFLPWGTDGRGDHVTNEAHPAMASNALLRAADKPFANVDVREFANWMKAQHRKTI